MTVVARPEVRQSGGTVAKKRQWRGGKNQNGALAIHDKDGGSTGKIKAQGTHQDQEGDRRRMEEGERRGRRMWPEQREKADCGRDDGPNSNPLRG